mgnify:CR=1 FL=1
MNNNQVSMIKLIDTLTEQGVSINKVTKLPSQTKQNRKSLFGTKRTKRTKNKVSA